MDLPLVRPLGDGKTWVLEEDYLYPLKNEKIVFIPKGFQFDFASIPRIFWRIFPPATGKHRVPALIHDWLCATEKVRWPEAADIFMDAMEDAEVGKVKRNIIYWAVRGFEFFHQPDRRRYKLRKLQKDRLIHYPGDKSNIL